MLINARRSKFERIYVQLHLLPILVIQHSIKEAMDVFSLSCSGANRYKNAFDQLMHWNWDPAANENHAQAPAQPTATPQSVPWCVIDRRVGHVRLTILRVSNYSKTIWL
jgi:hypothetical protein